MLEFVSSSWESVSKFFSYYVLGSLYDFGSFCVVKAGAIGSWISSFWSKKEAFVPEYSVFSFSLVSLVLLLALAFGIALLITYQSDKQVFNKLTAGLFVVSFLLHTKSAAIWNRWDVDMKKMSMLFSDQEFTSEHTLTTVLSLLSFLFFIAAILFHEFSMNNYAAGFLFLNLDAIISLNLYSSSLLFSNFLPGIFSPGSILGTMIALNVFFFTFYFLCASLKIFYTEVVMGKFIVSEKPKKEYPVIY